MTEQTSGGAVNPGRCRAYFTGRGIVRVAGRRCESPAGHTGQHTCYRSGLGAPFSYRWGRETMLPRGAAMGTVTCGHTTCRAREDRQDMRCVRAYGHDGTHLHTYAIGWCQRPDLAGQGGRRGGHLTGGTVRP